MGERIFDLNPDVLTLLPDVRDLPGYKAHEWTRPRKREFTKGAIAALCGDQREQNPWRKTIGGRDYGAFENSWNVGFDAAIRALKEKE